MGLKFLVASAIISAITFHYAKCDSFCWEKLSCGECIQTRGCSWCKMSSFEGPRCGSLFELEKYNCDKKEIESALLELRQENRPRSPPTSSSFSPPEYKVRMRVGEKVNLTARFSFERKRSLDLYYLLDASCTMQKFRRGLTELAGDLTTRLEEITKDMRLGFGSFIDKPVMPFISDPQDAISGSGKTCGGIPMAETYGFRNYLHLSKDTAEFTRSVNNSHVSGNFDLPEGGLDALLQAAVCKKEIGWRDETLRIVVLATDDKSFHITGDGKVGGIVAPHDGNCYLTDKGGYQEYSMSTELDYPSIALVNDKLRESGIHVIFATPNTSLYTGLSGHIDGSSTVPLSKNQSGSIVEVVIQELKKITDTVEIMGERTETYRIKYYSKCNSSAEFVAGGKCNITGEASEDEYIIEYQIELEVLKCPSGDDADPEESIEIGPIGFDSKLKILLTPACSCSCEKQDEDVGPSPEYCQNGRSTCGQCACSEGYCGKKCDKFWSNTTHAPCYRDGRQCSGNGTCHCGECHCQNELMGSLCQFNRSQCPLGQNSSICSGRGICTTKFIDELMDISENNQNQIRHEIIHCHCHPGFTGAFCNCTEDTSNCRATPESSVCSKNGDCKCNNCECGLGLKGKFCEECILLDFEEELSINPEFRTCMDRQFSDFSDISLLPCFSKHFPMSPIVRIVDEIPDSNCNRSMSPCRLEEYRHPKTDCKYQFRVNCNPENISVVIIQWNQYGTECKGPKDLMGVFVGVAATIVIAGIVALIAWKIATHYYDKQEFLKFEKERANAQWPTENNPLYIETTTMHMNPSYGADEEELPDCETQE